MKLPNAVRVAWWIALLVGLGYYLFARFAQLLGGQSTPFDVAALVLFAALMLAPVFTEVKLWGVSLKQELVEAKKEIKGELESVKQLINNVQFTNAISQQVHIGAPPPDASLPIKKNQIREVVQELLEEGNEEPPAQELSLSPEATELFRIRYLLEREIRRIARGRDLDRQAPSVDGHRSVYALIKLLQSAEVIPPELAAGIRDVYSICSRGVHGEPLTRAQIEFAESTGPDLIRALTTIA